MKARIFAVAIALVLSACSSDTVHLTPQPTSTSPTSPGTGTPTATIAASFGTALSLAGPGSTASFTASEANYSGAFTAVSSNTTIATVSAGNVTTSSVRKKTNAIVPGFIVTAVALGSTTLVVTDATGNTATFPVTVTAAGPVGPVAAIVITNVPSATAGTPLTATINVAETDSAGRIITGTYATPITFSTNFPDALTFTTAGSDNPPQATLLSSSDTIQIAYSGIAYPSLQIIATAGPNVGVTAFLKPTLAPIVYSGPMVNGQPGIVLSSDLGTGASATFSVSEVGLTNAPYNKTIQIGASSCDTSHFDTAGLASGSSNSYTIRVGSAAVGATCTITITDSAEQQLKVPVSYTPAPSEASPFLTDFTTGVSFIGDGESITPGPGDGKLWYVNYTNGTDIVGSITTSGVVNETVTNSSSTGRNTSIVSGSDGNLWFTEFFGGKIGKIDAHGTLLNEYSLPNNNAAFPRQITSGPDKNLWFTANHALGRITTAGVVAEYTTGLASVDNPYGIAAGPDGNLWFTTSSSGHVGKIDPQSGTITEFSAGLTPGVTLQGIVKGPDNAMWFCEIFGQNGGGIGRIDPSSGQITEFKSGLPSNANPFAITAASDGNLWFTDNGTGSIGQITSQGVITEFGPIGTNPGGITFGPDGNIWAVGGGDGGIYRLQYK